MSTPAQSEGRLQQQGSERQHASVVDGLQGLRSRLSGIKDSFSSLKGRWSGQHRSSQEHPRAPGPSTPATPSVSHPQQQRTPSS